MPHDIRPDESSDLTADRLLPLVYDELRKIAASRMSVERGDHTLSATALVHEAYLRLASSQPQPLWDSPGHFFSAAAEAMRRILVDRARARNSLKRGASRKRLLWDSDSYVSPQTPAQWSALDEALVRLEEVDRQAAEIVKLRFFAGLTLADIAAALQIAPRTTDRLWAYARSWLLRELQDEELG